MGKKREAGEHKSEITDSGEPVQKLRKKHHEKQGTSNHVKDRNKAPSRRGKSKSIIDIKKKKLKSMEVKQETVKTVKVLSTQSVLTEKLKHAQTKRAEKNLDVNVVMPGRLMGSEDGQVDSSDKIENVDQLTENRNAQNINTSDIKREPEVSDKKVKIHKVKSEKKNSTKVSSESPEVETKMEVNVNETTVDNPEVEEVEEDPEKAAIRKKKRLKRKEKKLEKARKKQEQKDKAGTAKILAVEYLDTWKTNREEWKFLKVRQTWLFHNMYDQLLMKDEKFIILLEYLEGLKGKARQVSVTEAEKMLADNEESGSEDDTDDKDEAQETEKKHVDPVKRERARQIIQLLSD